MQAVGIAFGAGKNNVKLYFMNGLPTETTEDVVSISDLARKVVHRFYQTPNRNKARPVSVTVSVSCFVPKPFTPFQWVGQDTLSSLKEKQEALRLAIQDKKIRYNWHDAEVSFIEAVFARGDRRLSKALLLAAEENMMFDAWDEFFSFEKWTEIFERAGIDPTFYANRTFALDEWLPWDVIDCGVDKAYLKREYERAYQEKTTPSCAEHCNGCGANKLGGKTKWCR